MSQSILRNRTRRSQNGKVLHIYQPTPGSQTLQQKSGIATFGNRFWATFIRVGVFVPISAAAIVGIIYVAKGKPMQQSLVWWSIPITIAAGVAIAVFCNTLATAEKINPLSYDELQSELAHYKIYCDNVKTKEGPEREAAECYDAIQKHLPGANSLSWALGTGYISVWKMMHHIQETFMEFGSQEAVIREALGDTLCIKGSEIQNSEVLLNTLAQAIKVLDPSAARYFDENKPSTENNPPLSGVNTSAVANNVSLPSTNNPTGTLSAVATPGQARSMLREVRAVLNQFISDRWTGLVHTRNLLLATIAITGVFIYLLLITAILINTSAAPVKAGIVLYVVGTISGLFGWLYKGSRVDRTLNDYGLSFARLVATPLLSGLSGIGGVLITAALSASPSLENLFSLKPDSLIKAVLFGLIPSLIIGVLFQESEKYVKDLKSVQPSNQGTY